MPTIDEIRSKISGLTPDKPVNPFEAYRPQYNTYGEDPGAVRAIEYNVPKSAIYDQLSDGSYVAKYENYLGATGNEDRLAQQQSWYEQAGKGLWKNLGKVGNYALDATVGTAYGAFNAVTQGKLSSLWDNDFSNMVDDWNKQLDYGLPNYYTDEEKSKGILSSNLLTPNFWFNDVAGGLAFVAGAILPEIAIGVLSGGATAPTSAARLGFSASSKLGKALGKIDDVTKFSAGRQVLRDAYAAKLGELGGNIASTSSFLLRTSNFEAGMEARHNFKDAITNYMQSFEEMNGRQPSYDELSKFTEQARKASNGVYATNMAILSVSNAAMYGKTFNIKTPQLSKNLTNWGNGLIGLGTETKLIDNVLTTTLKPATKLQKFAGNTYKILGKPAIEGIYEEGFQGVAGKAMQNYLEGKYDPNSIDGYSITASIYDAFGEQYGTKEGWKEMGIGMIIGFAGGAVQPGQMKSAFSGIGQNSRKAAQTQLEKDVEEVNSGISALRSMNRSSSIRNFRNISDTKADKYESSNAENVMMNYEFIKTQEHLKSPSQIKKDFETIIDNMELDPEAINTLEANGTDVTTYKESLKTDFRTDLDAYNFAKNTVASLGLDVALQNTPGNLSDVQDAFTVSFMLGKKSASAAKDIANQIDTLIGTSGMFDYMQHYNQLTADKKERVEELRGKRQQLRRAEKAAYELGQRVAGVQVAGRRNLADETLQRKYNQEAIKLTTAQVRVNELRSEIDDLKDAIKDDFKKTGFQFGTDSLIDNDEISTDDLIDNLDKLDTYISSLNKAGKKNEADSLEYLVKQFKIFTDANTEMVNMSQMMRDTKFFSTKKGAGMISSIVGDKFVISEEFKKEIEENNEYIRRSIANFTGVDPQTIDALEAIQTNIENNPRLSEREKYRLSGILRLQLGMQTVVDKVNDIMDVSIEFSTEKTSTPSPMTGDTVVIRQAEEIKARDIDNLDILNQTIVEITSQLDFIREKSFRSASKIAPLQQEREALTKETKEQRTKAELEEQLRIERESEFASPELIAELEAQIADIQIEDTAPRVAEIDERLGELATSYKIISSPEYLRLNELYVKQETEPLTDKEQEELTELEEDTDQWLLITGTIAGGLRLSDLIQQKVTLEQTPIAALEDVEIIETKDTQEGIDFKDRSGNNYYDVNLVYDAVTAAKEPKTGFIEIAGINAEDLAQEIGFDIEYKISPKNTILLQEDEVVRINNAGKVKILPTNNDLTTSYSVVTTLISDMSGANKRVPLRSTFSNEFVEAMDIPEIFGLNPGESFSLEIDANDEYNRQLLDEYQSKVGVQNITEDQEESMVESRYEELLKTDGIYTTKKAEITKVETELKDKKLSEKDKAQKNKKLTTLNTQITRREDVLRDKAQKDINKLKNNKATEEQIAEAQDKLARSLVIKQKDKDNNFIGILKGIRPEGSKGQWGEKFEALRYQTVFSPDVISNLVATRGTQTFNIKGLKVKKVFMGHPTYNFTEDGTGVTFKRLNEQEAKKIVDIGYVQNGKLQTKTRQKDTDTSFLTKHVQNKKNVKVPFIVLEVGGKRIAYPVRTITQERPPLDDFRTIFDSNTPAPEKSQALNRFMAQRGVDIKEPGNAFLALGDNTNLSEEFFAEKLAQLENIEYFYSLDNWILPETDIQKVAQEQILVDLDVINPFHSPKVQMDLSEVKVDPQFRKSVEETEEDAADINDPRSKKLAEDLKEKEC